MTTDTAVAPVLGTTSEHGFEELVDAVIRVADRCKEFKREEDAFIKSGETFKAYFRDNLDLILELRDEFPAPGSHKKVKIKGKPLSWRDFCDKYFGVTTNWVAEQIREISNPPEPPMPNVPTTPTPKVAQKHKVATPQKPGSVPAATGPVAVEDQTKKRETVKGTDPAPSLEEWLDKQVRKIALVPYGAYAAKFAKYPQQHTTELGNVEGAMLEIYKKIAAICAKKLGEAK